VTGGPPRIRCPTLVVRGTETAPWLAAGAALMAQRIPGAELLELPDGHASHLQNVDTFMGAFRRRLNGRA
jgi:pimeloyl-ACP methyl ester carboxylesterase